MNFFFHFVTLIKNYLCRWKKVGKTNEKKMAVSDLKGDHEYKVRVSAENEMGTGPAKEVSKPFIAQDKPGMFSALNITYSSNA